MRPDTLALVGNGLSIDLRNQSFVSDLEAWDTSSPLGWDVTAPGTTSKMLDVLPDAKRAINQVRNANPNASDFEIFDAIIRGQGSQTDSLGNIRVRVQLRHLIAVAYSAYQTQADHAVLKGRWPLRDFYRAHLDRLAGAISFNYDLNFETVVENTWFRSYQMRRIGVDDSVGSAELFKPHGSIDYEIARNVILFPDPEYPITTYLEQGSYPMRQLPRDQLFVPRHCADVVLPAEASMQTGSQLVTDGWPWIANIGQYLRVVLIHGLSYWEQDRYELDYILDCINNEARIIIINPHAPQVLMDAVANRFGKFELWDNGLGKLPA